MRQGLNIRRQGHAYGVPGINILIPVLDMFMLYVNTIICSPSRTDKSAHSVLLMVYVCDAVNLLNINVPFANTI